MTKSDYKISQNFLTSTRLLQRIVNRSSINKEDTVLEIGTGKGHLTKVLASRCNKVYSIEIDPHLFELAQARLIGIKNIHLIHRDFLKFNLSSFSDYKIFANIPFSKTTAIIHKITTSHHPPRDMWLIMEKGAAKRFMGERSENLRSLSLKPFWKLKIRYYFRRDDFHPKPKVDCVLVHFSLRRTPDLRIDQLQSFQAFVRRGLQGGFQRNRKLLTQKQISIALREAGLPPLRNSDSPTYDQWLCLFRCYLRFT